MAQKLKGVSGVLGNLITSEPTTPAPRQETPVEREVVPEFQPAAEQGGAEPAKDPRVRSAKEATPGVKKEARRGRPPAGSKSTGPVEREKVSLRLRADLAATYREWSWEEHCQFSDLVDRAMEHYLKTKGKARKPETE